MATTVKPQQPTHTAMPPQQPTPERFFNAINAHQQTEALKTAVDLEVFTAIAEGNATAAAIAKRCGCAERGVRTLCDFLTIHGFLTKDGTQYGLAPDTAVFLNGKSPAYIGGAMEFMLSPRSREAFAKLTDVVRHGGTVMGEEGSTVAENPEWVTFARAMMPLMRMPSQLMAAELRKSGEAQKVLDIAAGHGMYGISVAKANPAAQVYAADWKSGGPPPSDSGKRLRDGFWQRLRSRAGPELPASLRCCHLHDIPEESACRAEARGPRCDSGVHAER